MKSKLRENRVSKGTRAKVTRIIGDLQRNPPADDLRNASGAKIFAIWKSRS